MKKLIFITMLLMATAMPFKALAYDFSYTYQGKTLFYQIISGNCVKVVHPGTDFTPWPTSYTRPSGNIHIPSSVSCPGTSYPYYVKSIDRKAFYGCSGLTSVTIPNSVTSIGNRAFLGCSGLTSVTIPNSVTSIGDSAFRGCSGLTSVTIPNSVTSIGMDAFSNCSGLTTTNYTGTVDQWCNITFSGPTSNPMFYSHNFFINDTTITNLVIPNSVTSIGNYTFEYCSGLTSVTIPSSVTSIGNCAFSHCSGLTSVTIPSSVTSIGNYTFEYCSGLTSVTIPNSVTSIGDGVFRGCSGLTSVTIPNSVTSIGDYAFYGCSGLTSVTIPNSVTSIGVNAFNGCSGLASVTIPNTVTSIGTTAFYSVLNIVYHGNATGSPWGARYYNGFLENDFLYSDSTRYKLLKYIGIDSVVTVNDSVSVISQAFRGCHNLTAITIPFTVDSIVFGAFLNCSGLTKTNYTGTVAQWCNITFSDPTSNPMYYSHNFFINDTTITNLVIPNSVTSIGDYAFYNCSGLTSVTIPNSVTSIGINVFYGCSSLTKTNYTGTVKQWCNITFSSSTSNPMYYSHNFFINDNPITNLVIPNPNTYASSVTDISDYAFYNCSGLTSVSLPSSSYWASKIGNFAFYNCSGLTSINIPYSITIIGDNAFWGCSNLHDVQINGCNTSIGVRPFPLACTITVPCRCLSQYQNSSNWSSYSLRRNVYEYTVNTMQGGVVNVDETQICDNIITLTATGEDHYQFDHWEDGSTANPRTVIMTQDSVFTAFYAPNTYTITAIPDDTSHGSVSGGGVYEYGSSQELMVMGKEGYHFLQWNDGSRDNPRTITVFGNATYTAYFAIDTLTVNVSSNNMVYGTVSGGGTFVYGTPCTIEAEAYSGYVFVRWSNGVTYNPYTFAVLTNMDIEAVFAPEGSIHNVTVQVQPAGTGTVTGDGPYANGETVTLEAIPNDGYHFVRWQDDVTDNPRTIFVTTDMAFTAFFEADDTQGIVDANSNEIQVWAADGSIIIEGYTDEAVHVYDMMGREVTSSVSKNGTFRIHVRTGVYLVKIGNHPIWKVVVLK